MPGTAAIDSTLLTASRLSIWIMQIAFLFAAGMYSSRLMVKPNPKFRVPATPRLPSGG